MLLNVICNDSYYLKTSECLCVVWCWGMEVYELYHLETDIPLPLSLLEGCETFHGMYEKHKINVIGNSFSLAVCNFCSIRTNVCTCSSGYGRSVDTVFLRQVSSVCSCASGGAGGLFMLWANWKLGIWAAWCHIYLFSSDWCCTDCSPQAPAHFGVQAEYIVSVESICIESLLCKWHRSEKTWKAYSISAGMLSW